MKETAQLLRKKKYINWFLENYSLKRPEAAKILHSILACDDLLKRVSLVENVRHIPNAMIISAEGAVTVNFLCRLNYDYYEDIDRILTILSQEPPENLYLWLSFDREFLCEMEHYYRVARSLEEETALKMAKREKRLEELRAGIEQALDRGDREDFMRLAAMYRDMLR